MTDTSQPHAILRARTIKAATTALDLHAGNGEVYQAFALLEPVGDYAEREALHNKALEVAPSDPNVFARASIFAAETGRVDEAVGYAKQAFDLDRMNFRVANLYAVTLGYAGRYPDSRVQFERLCDTWPDNPLSFSNAIWLAGTNADWAWLDDLARMARERGLESELISQSAEYFNPMRIPDSKYPTAALRRALDQIARTGILPEIVLPDLYRFGLADEVFELIDQASFDYASDPQRPRPNGALEGMLFGVPRNEAMMRDPRFPRLCAKLGLCAHWVKTERWPDCAEAGVLPYDFRAECWRLVAA